MRKWFIGLAALVAAALAWAWFSPLYTLNQIRSAAEARDAERMSRYIDYPALREDLKGDFRRTLMAEAARQPQTGMDAMAATIGMALAGPMVDAMVTPEGVQAMFDRQAGDAAKANGAEPAGRPSLAAAAPGETPEIERRGLDEFLVRGKDGKGGMVFRRRGLGWKLVGVGVPAG